MESVSTRKPKTPQSQAVLRGRPSQRRSAPATGLARGKCEPPKLGAVCAWREWCRRSGGALHHECQALRARKAGPAWRGEAPAASVPELVTNCTLDDGAFQARVRSSGGGAPRAGIRGNEAIERRRLIRR